MSWDAHLRSEVSGACRGLSFVLEALGRCGRVYIYRHVRAELLQLARVVARYVAVRGPGARLALAGRLEIPGRGGAREGDGDTLFFFRRRPREGVRGVSGSTRAVGEEGVEGDGGSGDRQQGAGGV